VAVRVLLDTATQPATYGRQICREQTDELYNMLNRHDWIGSLMRTKRVPQYLAAFETLRPQLGRIVRLSRGLVEEDGGPKDANPGRVWCRAALECSVAKATLSRLIG
jgi:hypothetical protein